MTTMTRGANVGRSTEKGDRGTSRDPRNRISPERSGISSLAAAAANQSIDEPKKGGAKVSFPMEPRAAILYLSKYMLDLEKQEILEYDTVYYLNIQDKKKIPVTPDGVDNYGFDNDKGEYICDVHDHLAYRFEVVKRLGKGSFG